jgi:hypothetical protein
MANQWHVAAYPNLTVYGRIRQTNSGYWRRTDNATFEPYVGTNYSLYIHPLVPEGENRYVGTLPPGLVAGYYALEGRVQVGAEAVEADDGIISDEGGYWTGTQWLPTGTTITIPAIDLPPILEGTDLALRRGDTISFVVSGLGDLSLATELWFTIKRKKSLPDHDAICQITLLGGLLYLNGDAGDPALGVIEITDAVGGEVRIGLEEQASKYLPHGTGYAWDIQMRNGVAPNPDIHTLTEGRCYISEDVTHAI